MNRFSLVVLAAAFATPAFASTWQIDPAHTNVQFSVRHLMISNVRGEFTKVSGTATTDDQDLTKSTIEASIDVASINTREPKRDEHLKSPDFFDAAKYPTITYKSKSIQKVDDKHFKVTGDLTMHGVTKEVVLDVESSGPPIKGMMGETRAGARATAKVNRKDFNIVWNKSLDGGGVAVGDEVEVTIDVEGIKK